MSQKLILRQQIFFAIAVDRDESQKYDKWMSIFALLSLWLEGEERLKYRCVCRPPCGKV